MRLTYGIAWFEDSDEYRSSLKPLIGGFLEELGFDLDLVERRDDTDFEDVIKNKDIDLILIDQNLEKERKGDKIVKAIIKNELYTEVLFYSVKEESLKDIRQRFEGVRCVRRSDLLDKTKKLIDLTIKKNQDIANIRGLFIAETIDTTEKVEEIISKILRLDGEERDFFMNSVIQDDNINAYSKYRILVHIIEHEICSLDQRIQRSRGKEKDQLSQLRTDLMSVRKGFKSFPEDILELRNWLAHAKKSPGKKNTLAVNLHGRTVEKTFSEEECRRIRALFRKHSRNLEQLENLLSGCGY